MAEHTFFCAGVWPASDTQNHFVLYAAQIPLLRFSQPHGERQSPGQAGKVDMVPSFPVWIPLTLEKKSLTWQLLWTLSAGVFESRSQNYCAVYNAHLKPSNCHAVYKGPSHKRLQRES